MLPGFLDTLSCSRAAKSSHMAMHYGVSMLNLHNAPDISKMTTAELLTMNCYESEFLHTYLNNGWLIITVAKLKQPSQLPT